MWKNFFFDYIYYRLYHLNTNKGEYQGFPPVVVISLIQGLFTGGFMAAIIRIFYDRIETAPYAKVFTNISVLIGIGLMIYNYRKYMNKHEEFTNRWKNEGVDDRTIKGYLIALVIILSFAPLLIIGIFF